MLVARQCDTGRHIWPVDKLPSLYDHPSPSRMSNLASLTTQPDWRDQYSTYLPEGDAEDASPRYCSGLPSYGAASTPTEPLSTTRPVLEHRHSLAQLGHHKEVYQAPLAERPDSAPPTDRTRSIDDVEKNESLVSADSLASYNSAQISNVTTDATTPPIFQIKREAIVNLDVQTSESRSQLGDDEDEDDDDMPDPEENESAPRTEAERRAERRKLKRFRLTHQQTRFLMSEFAKQAHPDAAHRERLSREIPGLSPRQVQVWFQNRRAKIKRLTVDDRERMMRMRAVPDDFDNVQALHSPYGAVQGLNTTMGTPLDYGSAYGEQQMIRPLAIETMRRPDMDEHLSSSGISPAFGTVGFNNSGSMNGSELLSPLSLASSERYYASQMTSPISSAPRSANSFLRQGNGENYQLSGQTRYGSRPLQPLQLRDTLARTRSESLQSPLRSSMSWKGNSLDYDHYSSEQQNQTLDGRQHSVYQPENSMPTSAVVHDYDSSAYGSVNLDASPNQHPYTPSQTSQSSSSGGQRFRATSAAYPQGLELRNQYHAHSSQATSHGATSTPRHPLYASPFSAGGFQSAPLLAPQDFHLPRTPIESTQRQDYHLSQLSAPMSQPQDYASAYQQNVTTSPRRMTHEGQSVSPNQAQMHAGTVGAAQPRQDLRHDPTFPAHPTESPSMIAQRQQGLVPQGDGGFVRNDDFIVNQKRKRTYSMHSMPGTYNP